MSPDMKWGSLHIDPVKPIVSFDISKVEDLGEAFNWKHTELVKIDKIQKCRKFNLLDDRQHFIKAYIFIKVKEEGLN